MIKTLSNVASSVRAEIGASKTVALQSSDVMTHQDLQVWLEVVADRLSAIRHETHAPRFWNAMRDVLIARRYTHSFAKLAYSWILFGTRYPQQRVTQSADFFPTAEQFASINADVISRSEARDLARDAARRAYAQGRSDGELRQDANYDADAAHVNVLRDLMQAKYKIAELEERLARYEQRNATNNG